MSNKEIEMIIRDTLQEVVPNVDAKELPDDLPLTNYGVDSILLMEFMLALEERLEITFDETFELSTLSVISSLVEYVKEKFNV